MIQGIQGIDLLEANLVKDIGWFKSIWNWNYVKLVTCILYACTAFTDATFFLFLLFQLRHFLLPLTTLKLSLLLHVLMCVTITCAYFFQHLSSFSSLFIELPLRAKAGKATEGVSVAGGLLANYMQCFRQLLYCLQVCPMFGQLMVSQLLLSLYLPFFTSACFMFRAMYA